MRRSLLRVHRGLLAAAVVATAVSATGQKSDDLRRALMPLPGRIDIGSGEFRLRPGLTAGVSGPRSPRLQAAILRALKRVEDRSGVPPAPSVLNEKDADIAVVIAGDDEAVQGVNDDESYRLTSTSKSVHIEAATAAGAMHGLETLVQLVQPAGNGYAVPAVTIQDAPRFRWRGLMIDCSRHFEPMDVLKRNLDAMAAVKLNVFHWHLSDDQGFRIESRLFPKLTQLGSDGLFYTQTDARELVEYARNRGIRVVPEFEMPGHSTAWLVAYPELSSGTVPTGIRREFGISNVALDPTREETYRFLESFLGEMAGIFPDSYVHIGGDETPAPDWKTNGRILGFMKAHRISGNEALQAYFNTRLLEILTRLHRRMVGWDEIFSPGLPKDIVIQSWRGEESLTEAARKGYQGVLSAPYYLDAMKPAGVLYTADPVPAGSALTPEQQVLVLGGEVCMWAEHLDRRDLDSRIWPRTAAVAERFWSARTVTDVEDMYRRLQPVSLELETLGLQHLSSRDAALRSLAGAEGIESLRTFSLAFEPVSFSDRYGAQHTSQLTPLTQFVDAVTPDPPIRHALERDVAMFVHDPKNTTSEAAAAKLEVRQFFQAMSAATPRVRAMMPGAPRLQPMEQRASQLNGLATIGRQAMDALDGGAPLPAGWKAASLRQIEESRKPSALVRFTFLEPLTELVRATP